MLQTKRFGLFWWSTVVIAVLLALLFAVETPISAYAEGNTKGKYMEETVMITASSFNDAQTKLKKLNDDSKKTYYLFETPIYKQNGTETYIAYTTTNNTSNAIKSIKTMYMKGGWSYEDYNAYLKTLKDKADMLAKDLYEAIGEYVSNLKAGKKNALYAKKIFDRLFENDSMETLSKFFEDMAAKGFYDNARNEMLTFTMQSNKNILLTIENALMLACKDSYKGQDEKDTSFFTGLQTTTTLEGLNGYLNNPAYAIFDPYVEDILCSLPLVQENIRFYMNSNHMIEGLTEEIASEIEEQTAEILTEKPNTAYEDYPKTRAEVINDLKAELSGDELTALEEIESFDVYYEKLSESDKERYTRGKTFYIGLSRCKYTGYEKEDGSREYENLLGLFMAHEGSYEEIHKLYKKEDFYPLVHKLSNGQRGLLKVGLQQLLSSILIPTEVLNGTLDKLIEASNKAAKKEEDKIKDDEAISVYNGVDRSLYQKDSGIALTSEAIVAAKSKPLAHIVGTTEKVKRVFNVLCIAAGAMPVAVVATSYVLRTYMYIMMKNAFEKGAEASFKFFGYKIWTTVFDGTIEQFVTNGMGWSHDFIAGEVASFAECSSVFFELGVMTALRWINIVSIGILIISLLIRFVYPAIAPEKDEPYIDIPRVMCSYEEIFGQKTPKGKDPEKEYIYYYGMKNPFLTDADQTRASAARSKDGKITTDILKFGIGDVANWTLKGLSRQWVAIYTSTDKNSGKPILASSLTVTGNSSDFNNDKDLISVKKFHESAPFDFNAAYAVTVNKNLPAEYLAFKYDKSASHSASIFSNSSLWGGIIAGFVLGGGVGALVTFGYYRKRKKKTA